MPHSQHSYDVVVLGAGASGLMCAFTAARRGRRVLVVEKANKIGKKILMSGGGRCNFTNHYVSADNFISSNPHFAKASLTRYTPWDFIAMVEAHAIDYEERSHSQLFCQHSAKDILKMLSDECDAAGVQIKTHCEFSALTALPIKGSSEKHEVEDSRPRYRLALTQGREPLVVDCHSLVVASGALSIPTLGGSGVGYDIATQFDIPLVPRRAGLVPLMFSDATKALCERLSGTAIETAVSCNGHSFTENILFTHRGLSGPAILQISNYWQPGDAIDIDLLPNDDVESWLLTAKRTNKSLLRNLLAQKLPKSLVAELQALWWPEHSDSPLAEFTDSSLRDIAAKLHCWSLKPSASEGYRTAEVTLGGVDTDAISSKTMEAKQHPGLYFIGEVLDVTGHLGGFNFQWAWSSGYSAGLIA